MSKEFYIAVVTRIVEKASGKTDTEQTAKVSSKSLMGAVYFQCSNIGEGEYPIPARPTFGFAGKNGAGLFWVPKVGDHILVMLDTQLEQPQPYYICSLYTIPNNPMNEEWEVNYPNRMGWITNIGHKLIFDDTYYNELIRLEHTFGTLIEMDDAGNYYENVVSSRFSEIAGSSEHEILKNLDYVVVGDHNMDIRKNYNLDVKGDHTAHIKGNYVLKVDGNFTFDQKEMIQNFGSVTEKVEGGREISVGGGMNLTVGGCLGHAILSNYSRTTAGDEAILVAGQANYTYGLGYAETISVGNKAIDMLLGNYALQIITGNIDMWTNAGSIGLGNLIGSMSIDPIGAIDLVNAAAQLTMSPVGEIELGNAIASLALAEVGSIALENAIGGLSISEFGDIDLSNAVAQASIDNLGNIAISNSAGEVSISQVGIVKVGNTTGYVEIDAAGNITVFGTTVKVGTGAGNVLTNITDPVVDTITGAPHIGVPTFTAG